MLNRRQCAAGQIVIGLTIAFLGGPSPAQAEPIQSTRLLPEELTAAISRDLHISAEEYLRRSRVAQQLAVFTATAREQFPDSIEQAGLDSEVRGVLALAAGPGADIVRMDAGTAGFDIRDVLVLGLPASPAVPTPVERRSGDRPAATEVAGGDPFVAMPPQGKKVSFGMCSWGFNGIDHDGATVNITAGHCNMEAEKENPNPLHVYAPSTKNGVDTPVGHFHKSLTFKNTARDYAIIRISDEARPLFDNNLVRSRGTKPLPITGVADPVIGAPVCKLGHTTGYTCGVIVDVDPPEDGGPSQSFTHTAFQFSGDSGGPIITGTSAVGIVSRLESTLDLPTDPAAYLDPRWHDQTRRNLFRVVAQSISAVLTENPGLQIRTH
ncbi:S1 family peptidase [Nocardia crassostreae]|uniref:S1 family peptidase n=1 Tax=Nocardia crassostreae TaxID=53428 RepID=UPI00082D3F84|nr:S1 family peptidase [Nocardia crassostreae]